MRNFGEPGARIPAAQNHPEALLARPQAFQTFGEKHRPQTALSHKNYQNRPASEGFSTFLYNSNSKDMMQQFLRQTWGVKTDAAAKNSRAKTT